MEELAKILIEDDVHRYFDKNGEELFEGDIVVFDSGKEEMLYLTNEGELGTDATNPLWIKKGRVVPCENGIYPLTLNDLKEIRKKKA